MIESIYQISAHSMPLAPSINSSVLERLMLMQCWNIQGQHYYKPEPDYAAHFPERYTSSKGILSGAIFFVDFEYTLQKQLWFLNNDKAFELIYRAVRYR